MNNLKWPIYIKEASLGHDEIMMLGNKHQMNEIREKHNVFLYLSGFAYHYHCVRGEEKV